MWRQKIPPGNRDSDEILSDEDELELDQVTYDDDCTQNLQSLISNEKKVQLALPMLSRLESRAGKDKKPVFGAYEVNLRQRNSSSSTGKLENLSSDSVIGVHAVQDENNEIQPLSSNDHHSESGDDSISDDENAVLSKSSANYGAAAVQTNRRPNLTSLNQPDACTWSAIIEEAHELATVSKKTECCPITSEMSEVKEIHTGDKGRSRPKFSFRPLPHRGNSSEHTALKDRNENPVKYATEGPTLFNKCGHGTVGDLVAEMFENLHEESEKLPMKVAPHDQRSEVPSVAELLENLQQKDEPSTGPPTLLPQNIKAKERKMQYDKKRILHHLGSRILDSEDPPEFSGKESSEDEHDDDHSHLYVATQNVKGHTMADLFQEAFSKSEVEAPPYPTTKQTGIGYHGRLQQVLQIEKDRHLQFLKHSQTARSPNDSQCLDVQILTRFLEAKLTVCQCLLGEYPNNFKSNRGTIKYAAVVGSTKRTIIFSSKICENVELEVGNFVRIHSPWKEVQVGEDEKIILCMYFSPLMAQTSGFS